MSKFQLKFSSNNWIYHDVIYGPTSPQLLCAEHHPFFLSIQSSFPFAPVAIHSTLFPPPPSRPLAPAATHSTAYGSSPDRGVARRSSKGQSAPVDSAER